MEKAIKGAVFWLAFFGFLLYWLSPNADERQREYTGELEKVLTRCMNGRTVTIGGEIHICTMTSIGERI